MFSSYAMSSRLATLSLLGALLFPLVACKADPSKNASGRPFVPSAVASAMPAGLTPVNPPNEEERSTANYSNNEWRVSVDENRTAIVSKRDRKAAGPSLPFPVPQGIRKTIMHPPSVVMKTSDGLLVGFDGGEWGGGLYWIASDGKKYVELGQSNVRGLVQVADDEVLSLEGLNHGGSYEGAARWVERASGTWASAATADLGAGPDTFVATSEFVLVVLPESVVRIGRDRKTETILPLNVSLLYPNSMIADAKGHFWIGMRAYVVELVPAGATYTPQWYVRP